MIASTVVGPLPNASGGVDRGDVRADLGEGFGDDLRPGDDAFVFGAGAVIFGGVDAGVSDDLSNEFEPIPDSTRSTFGRSRAGDSARAGDASRVSSFAAGPRRFGRFFGLATAFR